VRAPPSEGDFHSSERSSRRAGRIERSVAHGIGIRCERLRNEITRIVERRRIQLSRGVVAVIEQVIDLRKEPADASEPDNVPPDSSLQSPV
jgi:hypothetical protein